MSEQRHGLDGVHLEAGLDAVRRQYRSTALPRLFESFEERLEAVRANDVQWQQLDAALLPVEPETLAGALTVVRVSRLRREFSERR